MSEQTSVHQLIGHLFRHEAGKMAAVLTRMLGTQHIDVVEDIVQDTLLKAMEVWRFRGVPEKPSAWLYKVAHNKAIDWVRHEQSQSKILAEHFDRLNETSTTVFTADEISDSVLRMMFACCHPSIPSESQIALTLKTLGGLSPLEIANAFLTSEDTIAKRIYRAKEKIKQEGIRLEAPGMFELPQRLDSVLHVLYLLFNEGHHSTHNDAIIREDLCEEAMRLTYLLVQHGPTNLPKVNALLALMCLQASRFDARVGEFGAIVLLEDQDRARWNRPLIQKGLEFLETASTGDSINAYHVEASIASVHALAQRFEDTRWDQLVALYRLLCELKPGPVVSFNSAIALGYAQSPDAGIRELKKIQGLDENYLYLAAFGKFYLMKGDRVRAKDFFEKALSKEPSIQEAELIRRNILRCG